MCTKRYMGSGMIVIVMGLSGCASNSGAYYAPVIEGVQDETYYSDLSDCQALARHDTQASDTLTYQSARSTGTGELAEAIDAYGGRSATGAIAGVLLAGAVSASGGADKKRSKGEMIIKSCMVGRGYKITE